MSDNTFTTKIQLINKNSVFSMSKMQESSFPFETHMCTFYVSFLFKRQK